MVDWKEIHGDSKEKYSLYLCSREWSELKRAVHERARGICERCRRNPIEAVHHLTYERKYAERLEDLQATCKPCHDFTHGRSDADPRDTHFVEDFGVEYVVGVCSKKDSSSQVGLRKESLGDGARMGIDVEYGSVMKASGCLLGIHLDTEKSEEGPFLHAKATLSLSQVKQLHEILTRVISEMSIK